MNSNAGTVNEFISSLSIGEPQEYKNLKLYPLFSGHVREDGFMLLEESIRTGKVVVTEISEGGHVPELKVINGLEKDLLLLDGEELIGAKQNRIVNTTIIIGRGKEIVIPVSCVEQGRWSYRSRHFSSSSSSLYADLRRKKSRSVHSNLKRNMSYASDQSEIWCSISEKAESLGVNSETGSMSDIFESNQKKIKQYEKAFRPIKGQIGFVCLINNSISGLDVLGVSSVFPKVYSRLLSGYILDAIEMAGVKKADMDAPVVERPLIKEINAFLKMLDGTKKESFKSVGEGDDLRFENKSFSGFALVNGNDVIHMAAFSEKI